MISLHFLNSNCSFGRYLNTLEPVCSSYVSGHRNRFARGTCPDSWSPVMEEMVGCLF